MTQEQNKHKGLPGMVLKGLLKGRTRRREIVKSSRKIVIIVLIILGLGLLRTLGVRLIDYFELSHRAADAAILHVQVVQAKDVSSESHLTLPGTIESYNEAMIYSRANGFVKQWLKDIGEKVKKDELLAVLETPEIDRQVEEAQATYDLAKAAFVRWTKLRREDAVSQQELDEKTSAYQYAKAALERTRELLKFGKITAPFDGIVTHRNIKVGDLVNAGNGGNGQALFAVAQTNQLHVYVYVPQSRAKDVVIGQNAEVFEPQKPGKLYQAQIAKTAGAIDTASRTLQVDITVPDGDDILLPGAYVEVKMPVSNQGRLIFPTKTILFGAQGTEVAIVRNGVISREQVSLGVDYGQYVEILSGVNADDHIVMNPPDNIVTGQNVVVVTPDSAPSGK